MGGISFFKAALVAFRAPKGKEHGKQPVVRCSGTPPSTLSDQFATNYDRTFNFDSHDEREFDQISDDEACSMDYACDNNNVDKKPLPFRCSTSAKTPKHCPTKDALSAGQAPGNGNHAQKKPTFRPPPCDIDESEDDESEDGRDDWTVIDMEVDGNPGKKSVSRGQKSESASGHAKPCQPRIHPLCAAKYGKFFESQPRNRALRAH